MTMKKTKSLFRLTDDLKYIKGLSIHDKINIRAAAKLKYELGMYSFPHNGYLFFGIDYKLFNDRELFF